MARLPAIIFGILTLGAAMPAAAQEFNLKNLPGVYPQGMLNAPVQKNSNCTTSLEEGFDYNRGYGRGLPERVYTCTEGNVSIRSSAPPGGMRVDPDPYIHGERQLGERGYGQKF
ncbi:hypothetical protein [Rhizobium sp. L1K21]|uniref:hypothetical protein n=1 Tax=Rhizobium sp. L1K21 TaxID=2954933 RepID=UPI0020928AAC|nr:hypothetical protein [Rhizobium sp. L1K21]MCO6185541.1 hypothetical protein [Rhizobium sp. L1K21]